MVPSGRLSNWLGGSSSPLTVNSTRIPYVSGDEILCISDKIYTLENPNPNYDVTWSVTPAELFGSETSGVGLTAVLKAASSVSKGEAILTFTLQHDNSECGEPILINKTIWVGKPTTPVIQALPCFNPGTNVALIVNGGQGASGFNWTFPTCPSGPVVGNDPHPDCWFNYNANFPSLTTILVYVGQQGGQISVSATNECGTTFSNPLTIEFCDIPVPPDGPIYRSSSPDNSEQNSLNLGKTAISVYPNPVSHILNINLNENYYLDKETKKLQLFSAKGQQVYEATIFNNSHQINVDGIQSGIYYLKVSNQEKAETQKIIIL